MKSIVAVECFADKYFFGKLLQNQEIIRKEKNKNEVIKSFEKVKNQFLIGIVDEDRKDILKNPNLKNFELIKNKDKFKIYKSFSKYHFIFAICPKAFEDWIFEFLKSIEISLENFGYSGFEEFIKQTKSEFIDRDLKFKNLVKFILENFEKSENHISDFKNNIDYLIKNKYLFDLEEFKNI